MKYIDKNVYEATQERLRLIFEEFDNIYVSFSGGKDSGVLLNLVLEFAKKYYPQQKIGVFHLDYEAEYSETSKYVDHCFEVFRDQIIPLRCCVPFKVTTCTSMFERFWRPWDQTKRKLWVKPLPADCLQAEDFNFYDEELWDYDFQSFFSPWYHKRQKARKTCCLVGIRAQESLNRFRTIASDRNINKYQGVPWTTRVDEGVFNAYPIYDWRTEDIWTANAKFGFEYNRLYDLFHYAGVPLGKQRVASPFLSAALESLELYKAIDPQIWGKLLSRVNGVNFIALYGGTKIMAYREIEKPSHFTWQEYAEFLLNTLPEDIQKGYRDKLATSIKFWETRGGVLSEQAISDLEAASAEFEVQESTNYKTDKKPVRMGYLDDVDSKDFNLIPTYKRLCICIMKNDHLCKFMGFALTKKENEKRRGALEKYSSL